MIESCVNKTMLHTIAMSQIQYWAGSIRKVRWKIFEILQLLWYAQWSTEYMVDAASANRVSQGQKSTVRHLSVNGKNEMHRMTHLVVVISS